MTSQEYQFPDLHNPADWTNLDFNNTPADDTTVNIWLQRMKSSLQDFVLTKGTYNFYIDQAVDFSGGLPTKEMTVSFYDEHYIVHNKRFAIQSGKYNVDTKQLILKVDIIDNPIPLFVIWAACAAALMIVGAVTFDSVVTDVEKLSNSPTGIAFSLTAIGVVILLLVPVLSSLKK